MKNIEAAEVSFELSAEQDDCPVRGNALASGDKTADRECEDEILHRLDNGDVWAWAAVTVTASWTDADGQTHTGDAHLGCCSYDDEANFRTDPYYADLCNEALADLNERLHAKIRLGTRLAQQLS